MSPAFAKGRAGFLTDCGATFVEPTTKATFPKKPSGSVCLMAPRCKWPPPHCAPASTTPSFVTAAEAKHVGVKRQVAHEVAQVERTGDNWMGLLCRRLPECGSAEQQGDEPLQWWIARSPNLPVQRRNGRVVSWILETSKDEELVARACGKATLKKEWWAAAWFLSLILL